MAKFHIEQFGCQWVCKSFDEVIVAYTKDECYEKIIQYLLKESGTYELFEW